MVIRKRQLVMVTLILALGSAVFINWYYTKPQTSAAKDTAQQTTQQATESAGKLGEAVYVNKNGDAAQAYFDAAALSRTEAHDQTAEMLNAVIKDAASNEMAVQEASEALERLAQTIKLEADIEALISAKTGSQCLVTLNNETAQIVVEAGVLNESVSLQIREIIRSQTEVTDGNIVISEAK